MTQTNIFTSLGPSKRPISGDHKNERSRKRKYTCTIERFTNPGNYEDEITMLFDDGKQLYVSKIFLRHVSEVFYSMLDKNSKYVENKDGIIKMVDKKYEHVLELLFHLDPSIQKAVERKNVFEIVRLAEEYMIVGTIRKCRNCLMTLIKPLHQYCSNKYHTEMVDVLLVASKYGYNDIQERAIEVISKFNKFCLTTWHQTYDRIPEGFKLKILEKRLNDKGDEFVPAQKR